MKEILIERLYSSDEIKRINDKINRLSSGNNMDVVHFLTLRLISSIVIFIVLLLKFKLGYIVAPVITFVYYFLFEKFFLDSKLKKREKKLDKEALVFFEILTLTLESGRNLQNALEVTVDNVNSELSNEFKRTLFEVKFGKSLLEALNDTKKRIPSETINNIILNMTQTNIFGTNIIDTMYSQVEFLREKQVLSIREEINKLPNKISILSVLFIIPIILLMVLGPFVISYLG
jgi:tight adherence protein C